MKITLFLIFFNLNVFANIAEYERSCFNSFVQSKQVSSVYPDLSKSYHFANQVVNYCECEAKELKESFDLKKKDWISYVFLDKSKMLMKRDFCSQKSFTQDNLNLFYLVKFEEWFSEQIITKISKLVQAAHIRQIAGDEKWGNFLHCSYKKVVNICTSHQTLTNTHYCINKEIEPISFEKTHKECSFFLSNDVKVEIDHDLI